MAGAPAISHSPLPIPLRPERVRIHLAFHGVHETHGKLPPVDPVDETAATPYADAGDFVGAGAR